MQKKYLTKSKPINDKILSKLGELSVLEKKCTKIYDYFVLNS